MSNKIAFVVKYCSVELNQHDFNDVYGVRVNIPHAITVDALRNVIDRKALDGMDDYKIFRSFEKAKSAFDINMPYTGITGNVVRFLRVEYAQLFAVLLDDDGVPDFGTESFMCDNIQSYCDVRESRFAEQCFDEWHEEHVNDDDELGFAASDMLTLDKSSGYAADLNVIAYHVKGQCSNYTVYYDTINHEITDYEPCP